MNCSLLTVLLRFNYPFVHNPTLKLIFILRFFISKPINSADLLSTMNFDYLLYMEVFITCVNNSTIYLLQSRLTKHNGDLMHRVMHI